jgi:hypothetical protein
MSLSDKLKSAQSEAINQVCVLGKLLSGNKLSNSDKQNLINILDIPLDSPSRVPNAELGRILREEGYDISNSSIDRHRRGDCRCRESK